MCSEVTVVCLLPTITIGRYGTSDHFTRRVLWTRIYDISHVLV